MSILTSARRRAGRRERHRHFIDWWGNWRIEIRDLARNWRSIKSNKAAERRRIRERRALARAALRLHALRKQGTVTFTDDIAPAERRLWIRIDSTNPKTHEVLATAFAIFSNIIYILVIMEIFNNYPDRISFCSAWPLWLKLCIFVICPAVVICSLAVLWYVTICHLNLQARAEHFVLEKCYADSDFAHQRTVTPFNISPNFLHEIKCAASAWESQYDREARSHLRYIIKYPQVS